MSRELLGVIASSRSGDPLFASVLALLHFDGAPGGTSPFTDSSLYSGTQTAASPGLSITAASKFGSGAVVRVNATGISTTGKTSGSVQWRTEKSLPGGAATNVPITLEGWVNVPSPTVAACEFMRVTIRTGGANFVSYVIAYRGTGGGTTTEFTSNGSAGIPFTTMTVATPIDSVFHHWALCIQPGGNARAFLDGALVGTAACATHASFGNVDVTVGDGNDFGNGPLCSYDDVRATQAIRYTAAFTPPSGPFPNS